MSSPLSAMASSKKPASHCFVHLGSYNLLWTLKSPASTVPPSPTICCHLSFVAGLSPNCMSFWLLILTILVTISPWLQISMSITLSLAPLLWSTHQSAARPLPLCTAVPTIFLFVILNLANLFMWLGLKTLPHSVPLSLLRDNPKKCIYTHWSQWTFHHTRVTIFSCSEISHSAVHHFREWRHCIVHHSGTFSKLIVHSRGSDSGNVITFGSGHPSIKDRSCLAPQCPVLEL